MNQNGAALTNITNNPALGSNGNWIAYGADREGSLEIFVVRAQGGTSYNLTRDPGQDRDPDW
jgi:Tol biopolymer transport system component